MTHDSREDQAMLTRKDITRIFDVPPWLVDPDAKRPRFPRVRWLLRKVWPL